MPLAELNRDNRISDFLNSAPRFKFIVLCDESFNSAIQFINVGNVVATFLKDNGLSKKAISNVKDYLASHVAEQTQYDEQFGKFVCLTNIGILFEKELDFVPIDFLSSIAKNTILILHWQGDIKLNKLYFLQEGSNHYINMSNTNYIII